MDTPARILVVEDEDAIRRGLCDALAFQGYATGEAGDGREALDAALAGGWDLILLDVMMPELDGFEVCRRVRAERPRQPICLLTAKGREEDILHGFECGADDYVTKPFSIKQLLARVAALLRRAAPRAAADFAVGDLRVDAAGLRAEAGDRCADLLRRDVEILALLRERAPAVVSRDELLREVWDYARVDGVETRCVDMHIVKLRRRLEGAFGARAAALIETVRGEGYRLREAD